LLDEILVVFASLHLRDDLGAGPAERSAVLAAFVVGGVAGLAVQQRLLARWSPRRLLAAAGLPCAAVYLAWIAAPSVAASLVLMTLVGATAVPLYPLVAAQAYAALPGRSGAVNAAGHLFSPIEIPLPWLLGALADRWGVRAALLVLVLQPIGIAAVALLSLRARPDDGVGSRA
jgi:predicted MFS family arabinose efflux permease